MATQVKIAAISGSLRKGSFNTQLLRSLHELMPDGSELLELDISTIPLYNEDLDKPSADNRPKEVQELRDAVAATDGILIVSPEYNFSIPGHLKNTIDWLSRGKDSPLIEFPIAIMGASQGKFGTVKMQLAFLPVIHYLKMKHAQAPEVLIGEAQHKFKDGNLQDEDAKKLAKQLLENLVKLASQQ